MGALRESGSTKLNLPKRRSGEYRNALLDAVREAATDEFTILGELGRSPDGAIAYLARDRGNSQLVVLRLTASPGTRTEYVLEAQASLEVSVPAPPNRCPHCHAKVRGWGRFCTQCSANLWSDGSVDSPWTKEDLLEAVCEATRGRFEILGEMRAPSDSGVIYFARDTKTGRLEALRLQQEGSRQFSIGLTGVMKQFAGRIASYKRSR